MRLTWVSLSNPFKGPGKCYFFAYFLGLTDTHFRIESILDRCKCFLLNCTFSCSSAVTDNFKIYFKPVPVPANRNDYFSRCCCSDGMLFCDLFVLLTFMLEDWFKAWHALLFASSCTVLQCKYIEIISWNSSMNLHPFLFSHFWILNDSAIWRMTKNTTSKNLDVFNARQETQRSTLLCMTLLMQWS